MGKLFLAVIKGWIRKKLKKYRAHLEFNYKKIHLGLYDTAEEAYQARLAGEEKYFKPILDKYKDKLKK